MLFTPMTTFNNSLEHTVQYMSGATAFIQNLIRTNNICPFQFDVVIAMGKPEKVDEDPIENTDDDPDADDDNEEQKGDDDGTNEFYDFIGDIEGKLEKNKLKRTSSVSTPGTGGGSTRIFDLLFKQFVDENKLQNVDDQNSYLRHKRLIAMVDRRKDPKKGDEAKDDDTAKNEDQVLFEQFLKREKVEKCLRMSFMFEIDENGWNLLEMLENAGKCQKC